MCSRKTSKTSTDDDDLGHLNERIGYNIFVWCRETLYEESSTHVISQVPMNRSFSRARQPEGTGAESNSSNTKHSTGHYFFPASIASPFLHAMILIRGALTMSLDSILNVGFLTMKVQTSSQSRYVRRLPWQRIDQPCCRDKYHENCVP